MIYQIQIEAGSDPQYELNFGDASTPSLKFNENFDRLGPDFPDVHYKEQIYKNPGNFVAFLAVENIFGRVQVNSNENVIVQNPLGREFILEPNVIGPVSYPPGTVTFNCQLKKNPSHLFQSNETAPSSGYANNVHANWFLAKGHGNLSLHQSYGDYEAGKNKFYFCLISYLLSCSFTFRYISEGHDISTRKCRRCSCLRRIIKFSELQHLRI